MKRIAVAMALLGSVASPAWAGFDEGLAAYERGDYETALRECKPLAEQGYADAQINLGFMYRQGQGVPQDHEEAVRWFRKAAAQGLAVAQSNLGIMYREGAGVAQDDAEAVKWWRKAADQDFPKAQFNLGVMYAEGRSVSKDYAEAAKWYRKAAEQGGADAQFNLADAYRTGQGVPQDNAEAVKWIRKAAEQGDASGQSNLGALYGEGQGIPQDYVLAHMWFSLAAAQGNDTARINREIAAQKMTPPQSPRPKSWRASGSRRKSEPRQAATALSWVGREVPTRSKGRLGTMTTTKLKSLLVGLVCLALWPAYTSAQGGLWETYMAAATKAFQQGNYPEAEDQLGAALKEAEGFGPQDPRLATNLNNLGELYRLQGRYAEAEPLNKRALAIREKALGPDPPRRCREPQQPRRALPRPGPLCRCRAAA